MKSFLITILIVSLSHLAVADTEEANLSRAQAAQVLREIQSWDNVRIKTVLQARIKDNQYMLKFISEHHDELAKTEIDASYKSTVKSLLRDQAALIYISKNLSGVDKAEQLELDKYFEEHFTFSKEIEEGLSRNLMKMSGKALVDRVLYYSLINKYPADK